MIIQLKVPLKKSIVLILLLLISVYIWDSQQSILLLAIPIDETASSKSFSTPHKRISSCIYFVHGYGANNSQFYDMINFFNDTEIFHRYTISSPLFFDYFKKYREMDITEKEIHGLDGGITTYASDFYNQLVKEHSNGAQIDIVAHSLGGLIIRELLRNYRYELEMNGIRFNRIVTLGTPHLGSILAQHPLKETLMMFLGSEWDTPIIESVKPNSSFVTHLNTRPLDYMSEINWLFIAGVSLGILETLGQRVIFNGLSCDGFVTYESALGYKLEQDVNIFINRVILQKSHFQLIYDPEEQESYKSIIQWFNHYNPNYFPSGIIPK